MKKSFKTTLRDPVVSYISVGIYTEWPGIIPYGLSVEDSIWKHVFEELRARRFREELWRNVKV